MILLSYANEGRHDRRKRGVSWANGYWLRGQAAYDTEIARRKLGPKLRKIQPWSAAACTRLNRQDGRDQKKAALKAFAGIGEGACSTLTDEEMRAIYRSRWE